MRNLEGSAPQGLGTNRGLKHGHIGSISCSGYSFGLELWLVVWV